MTARARPTPELAEAVAELTVQLDRLAELQAKTWGNLKETLQIEHWIDLGVMLEREEAEKRRGAPRRQQPRRERPAHLSTVKECPVTPHRNYRPGADNCDCLVT
jgi:hypothetical protein